MSTDREAAHAMAVVEPVVESVVELWHRARRDVAPTVSEQQLRALAALSESACALSSDTLADCLGISRSSVTRLCHRLEARGLVRRTPAGRHVEVALTGAGRTLLEATRQRRRQLLEQALWVSPSPEQRILRDALGLVCGFVGAKAWVPRPRKPV
ncbi:MarR family transcriptional regulator [Streptomyces sp. NPDC052687]|uniref:MarR family winged helix-turn-helix transcriptional regulator n=1 Tax=Streptomyces sp. NPDC052687 TaxID=3154759 RepID=UPI003434C108